MPLSAENVAPSSEKAFSQEARRFGASITGRRTVSATVEPATVFIAADEELDAPTASARIGRLGSSDVSTPSSGKGRIPWVSSELDKSTEARTRGSATDNAHNP